MSSRPLPENIIPESARLLSVEPVPDDLIEHTLHKATALLPTFRIAEFRRRFMLHGPRLLASLRKIYGNADAFEDWFAGLIMAMAQKLAERPEDLYQLDLARISQPDWFMSQDMLAYSTYVDRFAGTLSDVEKRIPYLESMGVTYLHLLPFLRARAGENDGGFAVSSFAEVEPALGSMKDLTSLTAALRRKGISLCADFVLNHVADDHPWAQAARRGDVTYHNYFHIFSERNAIDQFEVTLGQVFPQTAPGNFTWISDLQAWVWTTFYPYQWDLNYGNPDVFSDITLAMLGLANHGIDIFRLDSAAYLWKREGSNCMNQPECHLILQALRAIVDIVTPAVLLKAEAIVPVNELPPYFGIDDAHGKECQLAYNSSLMTASWLSLAEQDADMIRQVINATPTLPINCSWLTYVRCHDDIGWNVLRPELLTEPDGGHKRLIHAVEFFSGQTPKSYATGASFQAHDGKRIHGTNGMAASLVGLSTARNPQDAQLALSRLTLMYGLALSTGGTPLIYMGDELGLGNDPRHPTLWPTGADGRQLHRPDFPNPVGDKAASSGNDIQQAFRHLVSVRRSLPDLAANTPTKLLETVSTGVLAYQRGRHLIVTANFTENHLSLNTSVPGLFNRHSSFIDCISAQRIGPDHVLAPWQILWLRSATVTVFGEALVDEFVSGPVLGGAPFNVARHLAGLTLPVNFVSRVGKDHNGALIKQELQHFSMPLTGLQHDASHPTGTVRVEESGHGDHRFVILENQAYDYINAESLGQTSMYARLGDVLYGGTLCLRSTTSRAAWAALREVHQGLVVMDLNWRTGQVSEMDLMQAITGVDLLKMNQDELSMIMTWSGRTTPFSLRPPPTGACCPELGAFLHINGLERLVVTYGADGYAAFNVHGRCEATGRAPSLLATPVDTVGAGDAFTAMLIAGQLGGWPLVTTLERATAFASAICEVRGAVPSDLQFYADWLVTIKQQETP